MLWTQGRYTGKKRIHAFFWLFKTFIFGIFIFMLLSLSTMWLLKKAWATLCSHPNIIIISSFLEFLFPVTLSLCGLYKMRTLEKNTSCELERLDEQCPAQQDQGGKTSWRADTLRSEPRYSCAHVWRVVLTHQQHKEYAGWPGWGRMVHRIVWIAGGGSI